jgi:glyoxylate carboligase
MVVVGGRAPESRWGSGSLQEFDHPALLGPVTKAAWTLKDPAAIGARAAEAFRLALTPHRGPVFLDVPMDLFYFGATAPAPQPVAVEVKAPDPSALDRAAGVLAAARTPVVVLSSDVWSGHAEQEAVDLVTQFDLPAILTGLQVAATLAVVGAVVGDFFFKQGDAGIGVLIDLYRARLQSEQLFGAAILACLLGIVAFSAFGLLNRMITGGWYGSTGYDPPT